MPTLTQKELKKHLKYKKKKGVFIWKQTNKRRTAGEIAGGLSSQGYVVITIKTKQYRANRLAWLYVYGYFPEYLIDHKNRKKSDNRFKNLREISNSCNLKNVGNHKDNKSGIKGVSWFKREKKWMVLIQTNKKRSYIGYYNDFFEAVCHRLAAEQCLDWTGCNSSSPAFKYIRKHMFKLKPIKKIKGCPGCRFYVQWHCGKAGEKKPIPQDLLLKGCHLRKKNKFIYF